MRNLLTCLLFASLTTTFFAQESLKKVSVCEAVYEDFHAYPNFSETDLADLEHTATLADYDSKAEKIKLTGIIYETDGVTPANDVIVYIEQANEEGEYEIHSHNDKNQVNHSATVKTDANGVYTFYTFVPGHTKEKLAYRRTQRAQHIHIMVKEQGKEVIELPAFVFDIDWMVTKAYKKRLKKRGYDNVLTLVDNNGVLIASKDIVLSDAQASK